MRDSQLRLSRRLERLELHGQVPSAGSAPSTGVRRPSEPSAPSLTIVKLKPKVEPAPALATQVPVVEPAAEQMEMLVSTGPAEADTALDQPDPAILEAQFEQALSALRTGNVEGGILRLERFAEENPRHPQADNALYFSGLGHVGLKDYAQAAVAFEQLIAKYPAGDAVLDGMLRLAECRVRLKQPSDAKALYTRVLTLYPGTAAATQAEQRLASLSP